MVGGWVDLRSRGAVTLLRMLVLRRRVVVVVVLMLILGVVRVSLLWLSGSEVLLHVWRQVTCVACAQLGALCVVILSS